LYFSIKLLLRLEACFQQKTPYRLQSPFICFLARVRAMKNGSDAAQEYTYSRTPPLTQFSPKRKQQVFDVNPRDI
jgi:hypothetical protein